jgi:2-iminobutanoate/2-iminopropanoate deaminase
MRVLKPASTMLLTSFVCITANCSSNPPAKQPINPPNAQRLAPYSTAVRSGNLVFFSGVIGSRPNNAGLPEGTEAQVQQSLENLRTNLTAAGLTPADVIKCTVFLIDIADYAVMNRVYGQFFSQDPPARSALAVAALPAGARVEIECIAATG